MQNSQLVPGQWFGEYQILELIGSGGMGQVVKARHGARAFALKILNNYDAESLERFRREAETLTRAENLPGFARVHAFGMTPQPHLVMELVEAPNLTAWRQYNNPDVETVERLTLAILDAISQLHSLGIVHRDLKPDNILIRSDENGQPEPIILDFGLATQESFESLTMTGESLGTPLTMAPEQWQGGANARAPTVDLWALGIIHYFLLTNQYPISGTPIQIFKQGLNLDPETLVNSLVESHCLEESGVAHEFSMRLLRHTLQPDIDQRAATTTELLETLFSTAASPRKPYLPVLLGLAVIALSVIGWFVVASRHRLKDDSGASRKEIKKSLAKVEKQCKSLLRSYYLRELSGLGSETTNPALNLESEFATLKRVSNKSAQSRLSKLDRVLVIGLVTGQTSGIKLSPAAQRYREFLELKLDSDPTAKLSDANRQLRFLCQLKKQLKFLECIKELSSSSVDLSAQERQQCLDSLALQRLLFRVKRVEFQVGLHPLLQHQLKSSETLQLKLKDQLSEVASQLTDVQFASLIKWLIAQQFGLRFQWPKLPAARVRSVLKDWAGNAPTVTDFGEDSMERCTRLLYLQSEHFAQTGEAFWQARTVGNLMTLVLIGHKKRISQQFLWAICNAVCDQLLDPIYASSIYMERFRAAPQALQRRFREQRINSDELSDQVCCLMFLANPLFAEKETNQPRLIGGAEPRVMGLAQLRSDKLPDHLKQFKRVVIATLINRVILEQKLAKPARLAKALELEAKSGREIALKLLQSGNFNTRFASIYLKNELAIALARTGSAESLGLCQQAQQETDALKDLPFMDKTQRQTLFRKTLIGEIEALVTLGGIENYRRAHKLMFTYNKYDRRAVELHLYIARIRVNIGNKLNFDDLIKNFEETPEIVERMIAAKVSEIKTYRRAQ